MMARGWKPVAAPGEQEMTRGAEVVDLRLRREHRHTGELVTSRDRH